MNACKSAWIDQSDSLNFQYPDFDVPTGAPMRVLHKTALDEESTATNNLEAQSAAIQKAWLNLLCMATC